MAKWKVSGKDFIKAIVQRLDDLDIRCYDSAIVRQISELTGEQMMNLFHFGDVQSWHNKRINKEIKDNQDIDPEYEAMKADLS